MTPLPTIANTHRVTFNWTDSGEVVGHNIIGITTGSPMSSAVIAGLVANALDSNMFAPVVSTTELLTIDVFNMGIPEATVQVPVVGVQGQSGGQAVPNVAVVVTPRSVARGRSFRGRTYLPMIGESSIDSGIVIGPVVISTLAAWFDFNIALLASSITQSIISIELAVATLVAGYTVDTRQDTQRRRLNRIAT